MPTSLRRRLDDTIEQFRPARYKKGRLSPSCFDPETTDVANPLKCVGEQTILTGWDFSTSAVKCLAFDLDGNALVAVRYPTDLWTAGGVSELSLLQLEGQALATVRSMAAKLRALGRLHDWRAGGISATHHTAGRIDAQACPLRRAICWNDQTLAQYHARGLNRLGGQERAESLLGGPWAVRYSLSHLVKDEEHLSDEAWENTYRILPHGPLAAGYLTGRFDAISVSSAASTGLMDLRTNDWQPAMLESLRESRHRELALRQLPRIVPWDQPLGPLAAHVALQAGLDPPSAPVLFPTSDDQQAGLIGGGAVEDGQMAIVLGTSAVVNSSSNRLPTGNALDVMRLNWGPYLWMRCYTNGAGFVEDAVADVAPRRSDGTLDFALLERAATAVAPGCGGTRVLPFLYSEPSLGVHQPRVHWQPALPEDIGTRYRAALEAIAYLIALGVAAHQQAGQQIRRITVSGGLARSDLMVDILAAVLDRPLVRLVSDEGPALGAAVTALAALERSARRKAGIDDPYEPADAVAQMVRFRDQIEPRRDWSATYADELKRFEAALAQR